MFRCRQSLTASVRPTICLVKTQTTRSSVALNAVTDQLPEFAGSSVLKLGDGPTVINAVTRTAASVVEVNARGVAVLQLERRFDVVVIGLNVLESGDEGHRRAVMHAAMQHMERGGHLIAVCGIAGPVLVDEFWADDLRLLGTHQIPNGVLSLYRRGERTTVHDLLFEARATIQRVSPRELAARVAAADGTLVLDTRTHTDRDRFGIIPDSIHVPRTVVEWHFDPANGYLHPAMRSFDQPVVLVCNGGYSSSLAAANLVRLGFTNVADLIGGHTAWAAEGLPVVQSDHSHLDTPSFDGPGFSSEQ